MKNFRIILYNDNGNIIYDETVREETEEKALIEFIKNIATVTSGDKITINEE